MAKAPGHVLGEKIGIILEEIVVNDYKRTAQQNNVYCDFKHKRAARNNNVKVSWNDIDGNKHDLDIVFERDGSEEQIGSPCVFIEVAWRRYKKHSKNKAQEISGAVLPIVRRFKDSAPFYGAILAGDFTEASLTQLRSQGFRIIYFTSKQIFDAFEAVKKNIVFDENTSDKQLNAIAKTLGSLTQQDKAKIRQKLLNCNLHEIKIFNDSLTMSLNRALTEVKVCCLYGEIVCFNNIQKACEYILNSDNKAEHPFARCEITTCFSNGDTITMIFHDKAQALLHLNGL